MKYGHKLAIQTFALGTTVLLMSFFTISQYGKKIYLQRETEHTISVVEELATNFERQLIEKVKINKTLSYAPILRNALIESNTVYRSLPDHERDTKIKLLNNKWKATENENNAFILGFTDNSVAHFLKAQQVNIEGEYGEIFLTNKYGVIIATTAKLTTLAHAQKYWWQGAFNEGKGAVFLDDRGWDESVQGYVLGMVIPVKENNEIIGMLKVNLNIIGAISNIILSSHNGSTSKLVRSGGEIIFENQAKPLANRIPKPIQNKIQAKNEPFLILEDSVHNCLVAMAEIKITANLQSSKYAETYIFGGNFESADHKKGNIGESWYIINYRKISKVLAPVSSVISNMLFVGFILIAILAFAAYIQGKLTAKPLKQLTGQSEKIATANFSTRILVTRKDEFGLLGKAFNKMTEKLEKTTTSIIELEQEIKQRKLVEKSLAESEKNFRLLFETSPLGIYTALPSGVILDVNEAVLQMIGSPSTEATKQINVLKFPPLVENGYDKSFLKCVETGRIVVKEMLYKSKWDKEAFLSSYIVPLKNEAGNVVKIYTVMEDITERKAAEQALKEGEANLNALINNQKEAIWSIDKDIKYVSFNNYFANVYSKMYNVKVEKGMSAIHNIDKGFRDLWKAKYEKVLLGEKQKFEFNYKGQSRISNYSVSLNPIIYNSEVIGAVAISINITEHKEAQQELKRSNATKDKFLSIIAHDLRSPLSAVLGFSDLLNRKFEEYDIEKQKKFVNFISDGVKSTYHLLDNLLLWSRSQKGSINFTPEKINLFLLTNEVTELLGQLTKNKSIKLSNLIQEKIYVDADKYMLATILRNLISNAIKFTHKNGQISVEAANEHRGFVTISVKDNGVGMSEEIQQKVFDISENITTQGTENEKGSGLGLLLCKEFTEKHGGLIWVESELGKGTSFHFSVPSKQFIMVL